MKTLTVLCNVVLVGFTAFVVATEGPSREPAYNVFALLLVLVPIFTIFALLNREAAAKPAVARAAAVCNLILLALVCWALVDQYPHPKEPGVIPFIIVCLLTPVLGAAVLFLGTRAQRH
jgi:cytochrome bd-type quinol oxidase subunit 2